MSNFNYFVESVIDNDDGKHIGFIVKDLNGNTRTLNNQELYYLKSQGNNIKGVILCKNGTVKVDANIKRQKYQKDTKVNNSKTDKVVSERQREIDYIKQYIQAGKDVDVDPTKYPINWRDRFGTSQHFLAAYLSNLEELVKRGIDRKEARQKAFLKARQTCINIILDGLEIEDIDKAKALAKFLKCFVDELEVDAYDNNSFTYDGKSYQVLTESEADDALRDSLENLIDDIGIKDSFTESAFNDMLNNEIITLDVEDYARESYEGYANDIENEPDETGQYENRLAKEMAEVGVNDKDAFVEHLVDEATSNPVDYMWGIYGSDWSQYVKADSGLISYDLDDIVTYIKEQDGRGPNLASYDGQEHEEGDYFIYRTN